MNETSNARILSLRWLIVEQNQTSRALVKGQF